MTVQDSVLQILANEQPEGISGEEIASELGVSRASVWKAIQKLQEDGYRIEGVRNKGYIMEGETDPLTERGIRNYLSDSTQNQVSLKVLQSTTSTNAQLKNLCEKGASEFTCVVSGEQTSGRGRRGRSFCSLKDSGIYLSILLKPALPLAKTGLITGAAAVAVCKAIEATVEENPRIKWVNDVYIGTRKVCGILTEGAADLEMGTLAYAILGIGVNVYEPQGGWPEEIAQRAGSVSSETTPDLRNELAARIIEECLKFSDVSYLEGIVAEYQAYSMMTDREITVLTSKGDKIKAQSLGVNDDLSLQVRYEDGREEALSSSEVSIKL